MSRSRSVPCRTAKTGRSRAPTGARDRAGARAEEPRGTGRRQRGRLGRVPRGLRDRTPPGPGRALDRADAARAGQPVGRHLGHHPGGSHAARGFLVARPPARARARPGAVGARRRPLWSCATASPPDDRAALHRGRGSPRRPPSRASASKRCRRRRAHTDAAGAGDQPSRDRRGRRRSAGRGRPSLRRVAASAGALLAIPADIEVAILAVVAQLLRPGDYDTVLARYRAPRRHKRRCVRSVRWRPSPTWSSACGPSTWP